MQSQPNTAATVSLVCGISLVVLWIGGMCLGFVPIIGFLALFLMPIEWMVAIAGVVTGIIGYRTSKTMNGQGSGAAIAGAAISTCWLAFQLMIWASVFLILVGTFAFTLLLVVVDAVQ